MTAFAENPETSKPENKFYAFFRSRSRSRSKSAATADALQAVSLKGEAISVNQTSPRNIRRSPLSTEHIPSTDNSSPSYGSSPTKYAARCQSRPISSTTTATHSTIAPLPSDCIRKRTNGRREHVPRLGFADDAHEPDGDRDHCERDSERPPSRSETPSTKRKLALHALFGIALARRSSSSSAARRASSIASERKASTSTLVSESSRDVTTSRRRSFRLGSRPATPQNSDTPPSSKQPAHMIPIPSNPLPLSASPRRRSFGMNSSRNVSKSSAGHLPLPAIRGSQPHGRRHSVGSQRTPHDSAVALPEEQVNSLKARRPSLESVSKPNKGKEKQHHEDEEQRAHLTPSPPPTMEPILQSSSLGPSFVGGLTPLVEHLSTTGSASPRIEEPIILAPRPMHAIPTIVHTPPTPQRLGEVDPPSRPSTSPPRVDSTKVKKSISQRRAAAKGSHKEQLLVSTSQITSAHKLPIEMNLEPVSSYSRFTPRLFRAKELPKTKEPGPDKPGTRGLSNGSVAHPRYMTSRRIKLGSFDFERPVSGLKRSSSTINRSQSRLPLDRTTSSESARTGKFRLAIYQSARPDSPSSPHLIANHTGDTSVVSFSSSIPSRSTGKGTSPNLPVSHSSSWGRASGKRVQWTSHGAFPFEHPASLPNSPIPNVSHIPHSPTAGANPPDGSENGHSVKTNPSGSSTSPSRPKYIKGQNYTTQEHTDTNILKRERKATGKGRSLDLGLGLSWAPSRVREEAVIPGLFWTRENMKANGSNVTKAFENSLSVSDFEAFKTYVHHYDAHIISLDGPSGLLVRVEKLLVNAGIGERERNDLMNEFAQFVDTHG